jgi:hypothetical protein
LALNVAAERSAIAAALCALSKRKRGSLDLLLGAVAPSSICSLGIYELATCLMKRAYLTSDPTSIEGQ